MKIQIVNSETGEVILDPASNGTLEAEVHAEIDARLAATSRLRPVRRAAHRAAHTVIDDVAAALRQKTLRV